MVAVLPDSFRTICRQRLTVPGPHGSIIGARDGNRTQARPLKNPTTISGLRELGAAACDLRVSRGEFTITRLSATIRSVAAASVGSMPFLCHNLRYENHHTFARPPRPPPSPPPGPQLKTPP